MLGLGIISGIAYSVLSIIEVSIIVNSYIDKQEN
jgi:hypothetical protein